jgi:hypothetical protein
MISPPQVRVPGVLACHRIERRRPPFTSVATGSWAPPAAAGGRSRACTPSIAGGHGPLPGRAAVGGRRADPGGPAPTAGLTSGECGRGGGPEWVRIVERQIRRRPRKRSRDAWEGSDRRRSFIQPPSASANHRVVASRSPRRQPAARRPTSSHRPPPTARERVGYQAAGRPMRLRRGWRSGARGEQGC